MGMQQEACEFFVQLVELYWVKRDIAALLERMQPEISWVGTGTNEICRGILQAERTLKSEVAEYSGSFKITNQTLYAEQLSNNVCVVYGSIQAVPEQNLVEEQKLHITTVCIRTSQGIKLAHCNISIPDTLQAENTFYVPPQQRMEQTSLRGTLADQERWIENLTRHIPGGVHQCHNDPNLTLVNMSDSFLKLLGYTKEEIVENFQGKFINIVYPEDRAELLRSINKQLHCGTNIELEYRVVTKNQGVIWVLEMSKLLEAENNKNYFYCVLVDITQRKKEKEELRLSLERHQIIMDQAADIIFEWDIAADTLIFSPHWYRKFGYEPICNSISRKIPLSENIHPEDRSAFIKIMSDTAAGMPYSETEFRICDSTGKFYWNRIRATAQFDANGRAIKAVGVITDISEEKEERLALMEQAQTDALTGLYNKEAIKTRVELRMKDNIADTMQALLIIDMDYFKQVNDTYGHLCGDTVLSDVADVLRKHFRASDLIGRIGGDEFLVYMPAVINKDMVQRKVECVQEALMQVSPTNNGEAITCSIGVVVCQYQELDYFEIYQAADSALYYQKSVGRNGVSFYDASICGNIVNGGIEKSAVNAAIDSEVSSTTEQKLAQYTFQMLYKSIDVKAAIGQLLEIAGRAYGVSRAYIFESSDDGLTCNNTFEWCATGISTELTNLQHVRYNEDLDGYLNNFDADGVFCCCNINTLRPKLYNIFATRGIRSLLQCAILDNGQFKGYVGFDECEGNCVWSEEQIRTLTFISNVLSVFLVKMRLEDKLAAQNVQIEKESAGN